MRYVTAAGVGLLLGIALVSCKGYMDLGDWDWDAGAGDAGSDAGLEAGGGDAGPDAEEGCPGICAKAPYFWEGPSLFWSGDAGQAPPCPYDEPGEAAWRGYADLVVPATCEPCLCGPSSGACELPSKLTGSTVPCPGGVQPIPFDGPPGWDGGCDDTNPINAGANVQSLSIDPLTVTQESCSVLGPTGPAGPVKTSWNKEAVACHRGGPLCGDPKATCIPTTVPAGFRMCIFAPADEDCPMKLEPRFSERHMFYTGVIDQRQCTECACGAPKGSMCTALVSIYKNNDTTCGGPTVGSVGVSSEMASCLSINPSGQPLGSKSATAPVYVPGACDPIPSVLIPDGGTATPSGPVTVCCIP